MNKVIFPNTWGYSNFINKEEQLVLLNFAYNVRHRLKNNGEGRFYASHILQNLNVPEIYPKIKQRIIDIEHIYDYEFDSFFGDFLSFNETGAAIHEHKDRNHEGRIHTRYNLLLSVPEIGGNPIYDGNILKIEERMIWRCQAGLYNHASTPVIGAKPRINISFGFQLL